jgi:transcriptional regulator with XRE-family HTH domain
MTEAELSRRVLVSVPTIRRLERGDLAVGLSVLEQVLEVLGLDSDLDLLAANDETGLKLAEARLPRPRRAPTPDLAEEI